MKMISALLAILLLCSMLPGCQTNASGEETSTTASVPSETERMPDTVLNVDSLCLADVADAYAFSYLLLVSQGSRNMIYRIYSVKNASDPSLPYVYIEQYETETLTKEFLKDGSVQVKSATQSTVNMADCMIFDTRFRILDENAKTISLDEMYSKWTDGSALCLINGETSVCIDLTALNCSETAQDAESEDKGLLQFMYLLYEYRGTGIQHFGPPRS